MGLNTANDQAATHTDAEARSINPTTGLLVERFVDHTTTQVDAILEKAVTAQIAWRALNVERRTQTLSQLADLLRRDRVRLACDITAEMGKPILEALAEVDKCAAHCRWYADNGAKILQERPTAVENNRAFVAQRPIGLVLGIMPWNFPLWQVLRAAVPVMLCGNGFVLKHARNVMRSALSLESLFRECDVPAGAFSVLNVNQSTTMAVLADDRIAAVTLTGSARAGAAVAAQAGALLKKSLLELGGSDPFIVLGDADVDSAATIGLRARFQNTGQVCIAAKRFILETSIADRFIERFVEGVKALRTGDPGDKATDLGPMARPDLRDELHAQIQDSIGAGASVLTGGRPIAGAGNFYEPTVLAGVAPGMRVFDEETFGPCAAVILVDDEEHAVALANRSKYGLNASLWTGDPAMAARLVPRLECGGIFVNGYPTSDPRVPIGGVKRSGYGRELSHFGVSEFANVQTVWQDRI